VDLRVDDCESESFDCESLVRELGIELQALLGVKTKHTTTVKT